MFEIIPFSLYSGMNFGRCSAFATDNMFIVAVSDTGTNNNFHVEYETGVTQQLLEHDDRAHPYAVAYDPTTKLLYWSDLTYDSISGYSLLWINHSAIFNDRRHSQWCYSKPLFQQDRFNYLLHLNFSPCVFLFISGPHTQRPVC